jgi:predicted transcriptional regulator
MLLFQIEVLKRLIIKNLYETKNKNKNYVITPILSNTEEGLFVDLSQFGQNIARHHKPVCSGGS